MERLKEVSYMIENFADVDEKKVLEELLKWLSEDDANEFIADFKRLYEID